MTLHSIANFTCSAAGDILWEVNGAQVSSMSTASTFATFGITVPLLTYGTSTVLINATSQTHGTTMRCLVVRGGLRIVNSTTTVNLTVGKFIS